MEKNEIKKALYKEKPKAIKVIDYDQVRIYEASTSLGNITFEVPFREMGENIFSDSIEAQLLIRWLI